MMIELAQSIRQNLLCRAARALHHVVTYVVIAAALAYAGWAHGVLSWWAIGAIAIPPVLIASWLLVFNTGKCAIPIHVLRVDSAGIEHVTPDGTERIAWSDYTGYSVHGWPLATISLRRQTGRPIKFDYLTFSRDQREMLFRGLDTMKAS